jgi:hypothetical protein
MRAPRLEPGAVLGALVLLALPLWAAGAGDGRFLGRWSLDLAGHLWTAWNGAQGDPTASSLAAWPTGVDLMPILGGWADVLVMAGLVRLGVPLLAAWNLVVGALFALAGFGAAALARALGAGRLGAVLAGLLLQLDGWTLFHMDGGRTEQAALGAVAFALAGALRTWRSPGWGAVVATGLWGASVVWLSWEHGVWLAVGMAALLPFLLREGVPEGAVRRWAAAAGVTLLAAGPWALLFLVRALQVRAAGEGLDTMEMARENAVPMMGWLMGGAVSRPAIALPLLMLALPWTARPRDRGVWLGVGILMLATLVLAAGPDPGLWAAGDLGVPGPYRLFQATPVLGWFHTPQRLLALWSLAVPVACGLAVEAARRRGGRGPAVVGALLLLVVAADHGRRAGLLPLSARTLAADEVHRAIAAAEGPGAVLDLPAVDPGEDAVAYQTAQIFHGRAIPYQATLPMLTPARKRDVVAGSALAATATLGQAPLTGAAFAADLDGLRAQGVRFVVVHERFVPPAVRDGLGQGLRAALGAPIARAGGRTAWDLGPLSDGPPPARAEDPRVRGR